MSLTLRSSRLGENIFLAFWKASNISSFSVWLKLAWSFCSFSFAFVGFPFSCNPCWCFSVVERSCINRQEVAAAYGSAVPTRRGETRTPQKRRDPLFSHLMFYSSKGPLFRLAAAGLSRDDGKISFHRFLHLAFILFLAIYLFSWGYVCHTVVIYLHISGKF